MWKQWCCESKDNLLLYSVLWLERPLSDSSLTVHFFVYVPREQKCLEVRNTVESLYSGHHRDPEKVSAIRRCPLNRGFLWGFWSICSWKVSAIRRYPLSICFLWGFLSIRSWKEMFAIEDVLYREVLLYYGRNNISENSKIYLIRTNFGAIGAICLKSPN